MLELYDTHEISRSRLEWEQLLLRLLSDLEKHVEGHLKPTCFFIEAEQGYASAGCYVDFYWPIAPAIDMVICGILSYFVNWGESVSVRCYLIPYQKGKRLILADDEEAVYFLQRDRAGWNQIEIEYGFAGEWSQYDTPMRWDL